jgi:AraC-like DNA-binding protein
LNRVDHDPVRERAVFWRHPHYRDLGLLKARFRRHCYALHTHPTYVIALITGGCERLRVNRRQELAPANAIIVVNPEECHDGEAGCDDGWAYRTLYPTVALMEGVARTLGQATPPVFPRTLLMDPPLAARFARAHRIAEEGDGLAAETSMLEALRDLIVRHADGSRPVATRARAGAATRVARYREMVAADVAGHFELERFADAAGVTRFQVIRDFREATGFTPSAFVRDWRVRVAGEYITRGDTLADAAMAAGFADQSHLTRAFKLARGFTPGVLRRAVRA